VCRLRNKLSLRDVAEMFLERGFEYTHHKQRVMRCISKNVALCYAVV